MQNASQYTIYTATDLEPGSSGNWIYHCAMSLLTYPVDEAIAEQLAFMGKTADADRAWMLEYRPDMLRFCNTYEWCRGQTKPFVTELQDVPTTLIAWLHRHMVKGHAVAVHDVNDLPRNARAIQAEFQRQGNKSVLSVPIFHEEKLRGIIGFDATTRHRTWSCGEVGALFQCAGLVGQAKYRNQRNHGSTAYESSAPLVYLSMRGVVRGVSPETIVGVRSAGNYSEIWLENGSMVLDSRTLGMWSTLLPGQFFFRVHRTAIVNALHIVAVDRRSHDKWLIEMRSVANAWPVSRSYRKSLRERMGIWPRSTDQK
jgi:DNA-binding LytR/AlgR family response regulator